MESERKMPTSEFEVNLRNKTEPLPIPNQQQPLDIDGNSTSLNTNKIENVPNSENTSVDKNAKSKITGNTEIKSIHHHDFIPSYLISSY